MVISSIYSLTVDFIEKLHSYKVVGGLKRHRLEHLLTSTEVTGRGQRPFSRSHLKFRPQGGLQSKNVINRSCSEGSEIWGRVKSEVTSEVVRPRKSSSNKILLLNYKAILVYCIFLTVYSLTNLQKRILSHF